MQKIEDWFIQIGAGDKLANGLIDFLWFLILVFIAFATYYIFKFFVYKIVKIIVKKTQTHFDDILFENKFFKRITLLIPAVLLLLITPKVLGVDSDVVEALIAIVRIYITCVVAMVFVSLFDSIMDYYQRSEKIKNRSIKSYIQTANIGVYTIAALIILSIILKIPIVGLITGLGAFMAILVLVFKDPILGLVGGVQISSNDIINIGDWITLPKYDVDGTVIDISLTIVKIRNFDNTISTVPAYTFVSESVKNWKGMQEMGARRIMRDIYIDMNSIKFCSGEMLEKFSKINFLKDYLKQTEEEIKKHNNFVGVKDDNSINGLRQTNIGVLRAYLVNYLKNNQDVNKDLTLMVRQMPVTPQGLPMQIYCFANTIDWVTYEGIISDIFDHVLAIVPYFEVKLYQSPSSFDFRNVLVTPK